MLNGNGGCPEAFCVAADLWTVRERTVRERGLSPRGILYNRINVFKWPYAIKEECHDGVS